MWNNENDEFYLVLPSNSSMDLYSSNTTSNYITQLPQEINLRDRWEVALVEIQVPMNFLHFRRDEDIIYCYDIDKKYKAVSHHAVQKFRKLIDRKAEDWNVIRYSAGTILRNHLKPALFNTPLEFITELQSHIKYTINSMSKQEYDLSNKMSPAPKPYAAQNHIRCRILNGYFQISSDCNCGDIHYLQFSSNLLNILGYNVGDVITIEKEWKTARRPFDLSASIPSSLYVYCDLSEHHIVGNSLSPLLRIVNLTKESYGATLNRTFSFPHFYTLRTNSFLNVEIDIRDCFGDKISFDGGTLTSVLKFRKKY